MFTATLGAQKSSSATCNRTYRSSTSWAVREPLPLRQPQTRQVRHKRQMKSGTL